MYMSHNVFGLMQYTMYVNMVRSYCVNVKQRQDMSHLSLTETIFRLFIHLKMALSHELSILSLF